MEEKFNYKYEFVYDENGMTFDEVDLLMFKNWLKSIKYSK